MEILSPEQIRLCDLQYLDYKGVESIDLMENAALALKNELVLRFSKESVFQILCGTGNNGGDGLALARLLKADGYKVEVEVFRFFDQFIRRFEWGERVSSQWIDLHVPRFKNVELELLFPFLGKGLVDGNDGNFNRLVEL